MNASARAKCEGKREEVSPCLSRLNSAIQEERLTFHILSRETRSVQRRHLADTAHQSFFHVYG